MAMESYEKTTAGTKFKTDVTSNEIHTWEEVLEELNIASENYNDVSGLWGKIRRGCRSFGKNNKVFTACSNARIDFKTRDARGPMLPLRKAASESRLNRDRSITQDVLLSAFDYESSVIDRDVAACLRGIWASPKPDQDRVVAMMQHPKLHRWIAGSGSSALFMNANCKGARRQSTSFVSAKLMDSIHPSGIKPQHQPSGTFALSFFCGEHLGVDDPDSGVHGMMRSLLSQLLLAYPDFDLYYIDRMRNLDYEQVDDLCEMFYVLIAQLPSDVIVFCIVDSISFFEEKNMLCKDAELVVQQLADIVARTQDYGCTFKLLLTSPWNSRVLYKSMSSNEDNVVWMPTKVPPQGGFTGMKWGTTLGADVALLMP
ncbi:hypothetical protein IFR05_012904 [Cadophora sp. M221]|nr:hypothetical protein IFR05_012904 [Cadophora sp. M221]